jgi:hypothetical protein
VLAIFLYLLLVNPANILSFAELFGTPPLNGKLLLNSESGFSKISFPQIKGVLSILRGLVVKDDEHHKAWFIEVDKIFQEKNLRIFYMPFVSLEKIVKTRNFTKIPDPTLFLVGVTQNISLLGHSEFNAPALSLNRRVNFKITRNSRKSSNENSYENKNSGQ